MLLVATPERWLDAACARWQELLLDHAYCEKKAASTALALIFAYPECERQSLALARLAREELRHFEQVTKLMARLGVQFQRLQPGRYAARLRAALATHEPRRRVDLLLTGALIEARSRERFARLATRLEAPLADFYADLERAEARHADLYLELAGAAAAESAQNDWQARLAQLAAIEAELISSDDAQLRFHSGPPAQAAPAVATGTDSKPRASQRR
jgi:tRNA 2-(methylsulfanyl)-N6-isopentenyladenosine37 hydroxylase